MFELPINGSRSDLHKLFCDLIGNEDLLELAEARYLGLEEGCEPLSTGVVKNLPDFGQSCFNIAVIDLFSLSSLLRP